MPGASAAVHSNWPTPFSVEHYCTVRISAAFCMREREKATDARQCAESGHSECSLTTLCLHILQSEHRIEHRHWKETDRQTGYAVDAGSCRRPFSQRLSKRMKTSVCEMFPY